MTRADLDRILNAIDAEFDTKKRSAWRNSTKNRSPVPESNHRPTPMRARSLRSVVTDVAAGLFVAVAIGWLWVAKRR